MEIISIVISAGGLAVAVGSLIYAGFTNKLAQESNREAEKATSNADEANRIATDANKLASDANTVAQRALEISSEKIEYSWVLHINEDGTVTVRNDSASPANNVEVIALVDEDQRHFEGSEDYVPKFGELTLDLTPVIDEHIEKIPNAGRKVVGYSGSSVNYSGLKPVSTQFRFFITWSSPAGQRFSAVAEQAFRHRQLRTGDIKRLCKETFTAS